MTCFVTLLFTQAQSTHLICQQTCRIMINWISIFMFSCDLPDYSGLLNYKASLPFSHPWYSIIKYMFFPINILLGLFYTGCYKLLSYHIQGKYLNARKNQICVIVTLSFPGVLEYNVMFLNRFLQKSISITILCSHRNRRRIDYIFNIRLLIIIDVVNKIGSLWTIMGPIFYGWINFVENRIWNNLLINTSVTYASSYHQRNIQTQLLILIPPLFDQIFLEFIFFLRSLLIYI